MRFIDLFSGCGGLSLGLSQAGFGGVFAVERAEDAFKTLKLNLVNGERYRFDWPGWLPKEAMTIQYLLENYSERLAELDGTIDLIAGGPPCQGYSYAGKRDHGDPRNRLYEEYLQVVRLVRPRFLLFENVQGFNTGFKVPTDENTAGRTIPHAQLITSKLTELGYKVFSRQVGSSQVGVPQPRERFVLVAIKKGEKALKRINGNSFFDSFQEAIPDFRTRKKLRPRAFTTVSMAISDLRTKGKELIPCEDSNVKGFMQIRYSGPLYANNYLAALRDGLERSYSPNSLRLAKHNPSTIKIFEEILDTCKKGRSLSKENRERLGLKKKAITPLCQQSLSATVTTLPDDILHYSEPRILTVREMARLQSFPDWFSFEGQYTTGGKLRKIQCPRYTQVGNAVPPFLGEALGITLARVSE